ncbi:hypothetical protein SAMN02745751_02722 [Dethiosulfatibacter aminovorans DSM 17477]|uniref:Immunity protein 17 n=1 Tax=Dethiosulfatibacter aminovorans DSM 17477 TaxID=1121476 RepID=A0A1M6JVL1_9FIRM|nr:hypothetical protein [Dethiosulfatibacter aminovorans]SHJ50706.1 hypothetical protein SAMN02745751_02722 [Dethiosulfatibacter aminovorans DSM 17477]
MTIWGILAVVYALAVVLIAVMKPEKIWNMKKIELFKKFLGDKGTEIFFYIWALGFLVLGIWLLTK